MPMPNPTREMDQARFMSFVEKTSVCWLWTGQTNHGYGRVSFKGKPYSAHRLAYEWWRGAIPAGLTLDHLCRNRACVNPYHLEAVTQWENTLRSTNFIAVNAQKTHCKRGHLLSEPGISGKQRYCQPCKNMRKRVTPPMDPMDVLARTA